VHVIFSFPRQKTPAKAGVFHRTPLPFTDCLSPFADPS
jgi:hypothetical protein